MSHGLFDGNAARLSPVSRNEDVLPAGSSTMTGGKGDHPSHAIRAEYNSLRPQWADAHPWLISGTLIAWMAVRMAEWLTPVDLFVVLGQVWLAVTVGFLGLLLLRRSARHAALVLSWITVWGMFYGSLFDRIRMLPAGESATVCHGVLLVIGLGLAAILSWLPVELKPLSTFVSLAAAITLTIFSVNFGLAMSRQLPEQRSNLAETLPVSSKFAAQDEGHPDIYYLILDGYGRSDVLRDYYGFDNAEFLDGLRQRGFYVADKGSANYPGTMFALSSSLNMRYHDHTLSDGRSPGACKRLIEMVRTHEVGLRLRERGYKLVHFNTTFPPTARSNIAHVSLGEQAQSWSHNFLMQELTTRCVWRFMKGGAYDMLAAQHRRALAELRDVPAISAPKFTFLHLIAPHPPFLIDREGRNHWNANQSARESYVDQLAFINREVTAAIDAILAKSTVRPIIIVQSDHGPGFCTAKLESTDRDADYVQERVPILNAHLVPESMRQKLYPTITPVNTFRLLLTECFGFEYPLLPDRNFMYSESWLTLGEITDGVENGTPQRGLHRPETDGPSNGFVP